jgi:hypothetical protein
MTVKQDEAREGGNHHYDCRDDDRDDDAILTPHAVAT